MVQGGNGREAAVEYGCDFDSVSNELSGFGGGVEAFDEERVGCLNVIEGAKQTFGRKETAKLGCDVAGAKGACDFIQQ